MKGLALRHAVAQQVERPRPAAARCRRRLHLLPPLHPSPHLPHKQTLTQLALCCRAATRHPLHARRAQWGGGGPRGTPRPLPTMH
jgi:hypothetical protein